MRVRDGRKRDCNASRCGHWVQAVRLRYLGRGRFGFFCAVGLGGAVWGGVGLGECGERLPDGVPCAGTARRGEHHGRVGFTPVANVPQDGGCRESQSPAH